MSLICVNDMPEEFLGQSSQPTTSIPVPRGANMGMWFGAGRPFRLSAEAGGFCQRADQAIAEAIVDGNKTGDTGRYKFALADVAKTQLMGPAYATASEVTKYFSKPEAEQLMISLWDEYADGKSISACTISFPKFDILDPNTQAPEGAGMIPGSKYEVMRRAPTVVTQTGSGSSAVPKGQVELVKLQPDGSVRVDGWALIPSAPNTPVRVDVMSELASGAKTQTKVSVPTGMPRPDVAKSQNVTGNHGFVAVVPPQESGSYTIYAYAVNMATNESTPLSGTPTGVMVAKPMTSAQVAVTSVPQPGQWSPPVSNVQPSIDLPDLPSTAAPTVVVRKSAAKTSNDKLILLGITGLSAVAILFALTRRKSPRHPLAPMPMPLPPPPPPPQAPKAPQSAASVEPKKLNRGSAARQGRSRRPS